MSKKNINKGKITAIEPFKHGKYPLGVPIDYILTTTSYVVYVDGEKPFQIERDDLLKHDSNRKKITKKFRESFIGKDADILRPKDDPKP